MAALNCVYVLVVVFVESQESGGELSVEQVVRRERGLGDATSRGILDDRSRFAVELEAVGASVVLKLLRVRNALHRLQDALTRLGVGLEHGAAGSYANVLHLELLHGRNVLAVSADSGLSVCSS